LCPPSRGMWGYRKQLDGIVARLEALQTAQVPSADRSEELDRVTQLTDDYRALAQDVATIENQFKDVLQAVAEGIERTDRAERRIAQTVKRARKELKEAGLEDPGLEAEAEQLRHSNGERGPRDGLRAVPSSVVAPQEEASSVKGVSVEVLQRARGF